MLYNGNQGMGFRYSHSRYPSFLFSNMVEKFNLDSRVGKF